MAEILFYHLTKGSVENVLPPLLEKSLERGWRVAVQSPLEERLAALDSYLWTCSEASFLPHGLASEKHAERQPILLTGRSDNPNGAQIRFLLDAAEPVAPESYERLVIVFDGHDEAALAAARAQWQALKAAGHAVTYWQQGERGWEKKA